MRYGNHWSGRDGGHFLVGSTGDIITHTKLSDDEEKMRYSSGDSIFFIFDPIHQKFTVEKAAGTYETLTFELPELK